MASTAAVPASGKDKGKWDTQYRKVFKQQRYPRQVPARPTSASRRNNPHPVQDFLLYDRQPTTRDEEVQDILRAAITRSAPVRRGQPSDLNSIPVGTLGDSNEPVQELTPHWSQWPQPQTSRPAPAPPAYSPRPPLSARNPSTSYSVYNHVTDPACDANTNANNMMRHGSRDIIMHRGLSPRRAAPPVMPGRSLTHYGSFGNRQEANPYMSGLDLYAGAYHPSSRQSRPMHRHLRSVPRGEGYVHNHSVYYSTTPNVSGYFIIHPDWVSERLSMRRSQSLLSF